jgi:hypothetical protein
MGINKVETKIRDRPRWPPFEGISSRPVHLPALQDWDNEEYTIDDEQIGEVTQFYYRTHVAVLSLTQPICVGDKVNFLGYTTDFDQPVTSLQINHQSVETAGPGQEVAMRVDQRVRRGDKLCKIAK